MDYDAASDIRLIESRRRRREELTQLVAIGRLGYRQAEEVAEAEGVGSLLNNPSHDEIDGFAEPRWTLLMAFSWVAFGRRPTVVRNYFPAFRSRCLEWRQEGNGYVPAPLQPRTAYEAVEQMTRDRHGDFVRAIQRSEEKPALVWDRLKAKFRSGEISTEAQKVNDLASGVVAIPAQNWGGLLLMQPQGLLVDALCYADGQPVYFNVTVNREQLLAIWPPLDGEAEPDEGSIRPTAGHVADDVVERQRQDAVIPEKPASAQTRIAKQVMEENYPDGIPVGAGAAKAAFRLLDKAFRLQADSEGKTSISPPRERKWRDIKNGKY